MMQFLIHLWMIVTILGSLGGLVFIAIVFARAFEEYVKAGKTLEQMEERKRKREEE